MKRVGQVTNWRLPAGQAPNRASAVEAESVARAWARVDRDPSLSEAEREALATELWGTCGRIGYTGAWISVIVEDPAAGLREASLSLSPIFAEMVRANGGKVDCPACKGTGVEVLFMYSQPCPACKGKQ